MIATSLCVTEARMDIMDGIFPYQDIEYITLYIDNDGHIGWLSFLNPFEVFVSFMYYYRPEVGRWKYWGMGVLLRH